METKQEARVAAKLFDKGKGGYYAGVCVGDGDNWIATLHVSCDMVSVELHLELAELDAMIDLLERTRIQLKEDLSYREKHGRVP
jgi:hypothetical protein